MCVIGRHSGMAFATGVLVAHGHFPVASRPPCEVKYSESETGKL
jgi:hypothetical protein